MKLEKTQSNVFNDNHNIFILIPIPKKRFHQFISLKMWPLKLFEDKNIKHTMVLQQWYAMYKQKTPENQCHTTNITISFT